MFFHRSSGGASWMLVCLGNPGDQYENTRHNVGFMVADQLGERYRLPIQKLKFKALTNIFSISGEKVLVMPLSLLWRSESHSFASGKREIHDDEHGDGGFGQLTAPRKHLKPFIVCNDPPDSLFWKSANSYLT